VDNYDDRLLRRWEFAKQQRELERNAYDEPAGEPSGNVYRLPVPPADERLSRADVFFLEDR
jgi:hypothetical protein